MNVETGPKARPEIAAKRQVKATSTTAEDLCSELIEYVGIPPWPPGRPRGAGLLRPVLDTTTAAASVTRGPMGA